MYQQEKKMSNNDLKPTDYSNTIVVQNENNSSVVSIFPLVVIEAEEVITETNVSVESDETRPQPTVPQLISGGGSSY